MTGKSFILILFVLLAICMAENNDKLEEFKAEMEKERKEWRQAVLNGDLESLKKLMTQEEYQSLNAGKLNKRTRDQIIESFTNQFKYGTYIKFDPKEPSRYGLSDDGKFGWSSHITEAHFVRNSTGDTSKFISSGIGVVKKVGQEWVSIISNEEITQIEKPVKTATIDKYLLTSYTGKYHSSKSGSTYIVTDNGTNLVFDNQEGRKFDVFPQTDEVFYLKNQKQRLVFMRDSKGNVSHYLYIENGVVIKVDKIE